MDIDGFPRQFARTRRFSLGVPHDVTVSPDGDRVLFLRSESGVVPRAHLWMFEAGTERIIAGPATAYAADREVRVVACLFDGSLWTARTDGGGPPRRIPTAGPVRDPRPSPDGTLIAYVTRGALHVVGADGTGDRPLAVPETTDITYGLPDHTAEESIGRARGHWWSPDSDALLVARVDTRGVERRYVSDPADPGRAPRPIPYPAAGTANAVTSLHLVTVAGAHTPVQLPGRASARDAPAGSWGLGFEYVVSAGWQSAGPVIALQTRDQKTLRVLRADPVTGAVGTLAQQTDDAWVEHPPGAPLHTDGGMLVLPEVRGDERTIRLGDVLAPAGLHVRSVLGSVGERVLFTAAEEPTETHVWAYEAGRGFERLTHEPGVHTATAGGSTLVVDSRTPDGHTLTVLRGGERVGTLAVLAERPLVTPRPARLALGERQLRTRLHLPSWYEPGRPKLPVLLSPYAGPGLQLVTKGDGWHAAVCQWFAEHGFAVLAIDGRGTPGRGVRWQRAVVGDRLGPVLDDQIDGLRAAAEQCGALDLARVGIRGWSFSGYLAAGAVLRRPDVFHAAVAGAPPTDRRLYDTYWEERFLGHPDLEPLGYERSSLLPLARNPARPLLLVHGLADENVAPAHTLRLSAELLAAGRPHSVLLLPGVGHMVTGEGVADTLLRHELGFLRSSLGM
ncbi:prolyl oligopeptidase family serine peptidase [Streptomyces sp. NBC_00083]|uniref:prolyl oligopeptidase family serine peptidase n=1 Tax=Streptomyces sp. NBC_00083 TaxID=2975647 RepID=UPI00224E153F|nr:prolyl oligopeptidase family serine peptidase [Streptomyces sp. NBC_00083]MCX5386530.1 prolyl oligopeptidase family serine peptidase [Streptomyces sp. NBC_00083]